MAGANRFATLFCAILLAAAASAAGETPTLVPDSFNPSEGRPLREREWLEYLVAFPVDPLENSLKTNPVPPPDLPRAPLDPALPGTGEFAFQPAFDPPEAWLALPLRLQIIRVEEEGCQVRITFDGTGRNVFLPLRRPHWATLFRYEAPQPEDESGIHRIGDAEYPVTVTRRRGSRGGFVRLSSGELPFGLARFASEDVDISLVAMGEGEPPPFPLPNAERNVIPRPGMLYRDE